MLTGVPPILPVMGRSVRCSLHVGALLAAGPIVASFSHLPIRRETSDTVRPNRCVCQGQTPSECFTIAPPVLPAVAGTAMTAISITRAPTRANLFGFSILRSQRARKNADGAVLTTSRTRSSQKVDRNFSAGRRPPITAHMLARIDHAYCRLCASQVPGEGTPPSDHESHTLWGRNDRSWVDYTPPSHQQSPYDQCLPRQSN